MSSSFCLTVRFLQAYSHGRDSEGEPEWPPSPLRVFQALVAAAAARWNERIRLEYAAPALRWLERQPAPVIVGAPADRSAAKYRLYVPDNVGDVVAKAWCRGGDASLAEYRVEKDVRHARLLGDAIHYLFPVATADPEFEAHRETLIDTARSITHLGWGVDMVAVDATIISEEEAAKLPGERWRPTEGASTGGLRVPIEGTLNDLINKHAAFLTRVSDSGFEPVPPLSSFKVVEYRRGTEAPARPFAAFQLLTLDAERKWSRDPRWTVQVAGMLRHATKLAAEAVDKPKSWIDTFVLGHGNGKNQEAVGTEGVGRFAYVPLPTIRPQGVVGMVNRALIIESPDGTGTDASWARRMLSGRELVDERDQEPVALLSLAPASDWVVRQYTGEKEGAAAWSTVTPVVLPGYDDPRHLRRRLKKETTSDVKNRLHERLEARIEGLLRKAIVQAGFPRTLADCADLAWRQVGFRPGVDLATRYELPHHLKGKPRYHVQIQWRDTTGSSVNIRGPLLLGAGRYYGLGLFAHEP